jgi:hypothetical protein
MDAQELWGKLRLVAPDGTVLAFCRVRGFGRPDLGAVNEVGRIQLLATRIDAGVAFETICPALVELLDLAGLTVEMCRQSEGGEDLRGVEKEAHCSDPSI